jgi:hypothetical protein
VLECVIKDVTLMFYSGSGHMGGINTLINYVIGGGTVLAFEICVMVQYNTLCVIATLLNWDFKVGASPHCSSSLKIWSKTEGSIPIQR